MINGDLLIGNDKNHHGAISIVNDPATHLVHLPNCSCWIINLKGIITMEQYSSLFTASFLLMVSISERIKQISVGSNNIHKGDLNSMVKR